MPTVAEPWERRLTRTRWTTPIAGWTFVDDHPRPLGGQAVWHFPGQDFAYAELDGADLDLAFDVPPGGGL